MQMEADLIISEQESEDSKVHFTISKGYGSINALRYFISSGKWL